MANQAEYMDRYEFWLKDSCFDEETKRELEALKGNEKEIEDRFYKDLEFGTGGLRGVIGAGTNRMNVYTVRRATQGLANYILKQGGSEKGVAIAYDSRRMSPEFADVAALCLAANGIKAYVFESLRPTPELSFAIRELHCISGIVITASHNPPEYNGYKCYWEDGAQVTSPKDVDIIAEVNAIEDFGVPKTMDKDAAVAAGLYITIGSEIDDKYIAELKKQVVHPEIIKEMADDIKIVYTPFHGTGHVPVMRVLKELGFTQVYEVPEQALPDPDFTTLEYPNPEDHKAFELALKLAKEKDADIVMATDPDADRLGIYAKDTKTGEYMKFTGNMSGMLLADYEFRQRKEAGILPDNAAFISTIVTSKLGRAIAEKYGVFYREVLTGFKFIGEQIKLFEETGEHTYVFGMEESYGALIGTHARDKDAPDAVMCLCELASWCKKQGITLWDQMINVYEEYGYYLENQISITRKGVEGLKEIAAVMEKIRNNPPKKIGKWDVIEFRDYKSGKTKDMSTGAEGETGLPSSNVLFFQLNDDAWCCARPSGTEPKLKFYVGVKTDSMEGSEADIKALSDELMKMAEI